MKITAEEIARLTRQGGTVTAKKRELDYDAIYSQDFGGRDPSEPHGWIQWKGTDICIDLHCACGHHGHVDADFFYYYRCPACQRVYAVGQNVKLIALTPEQTAEVERTSNASLQTDTTS